MAGLRETIGRDLEARGLPPQWRWRYVLTKRLAYFQALLRVVEQLKGARGWRRGLYYAARWKFELLSERMGLDVPAGVFGPGLWITHRGAIVVNGDARVGANCTIHQGVTIGHIRGEAPVIEDDVFIGPSAGIYGPVRIGRGARLGPHALVVDDVPAGAVVVAPRATTP